MPYWIVVTRGGREGYYPPIGTKRVLGREELEDGTIRWLLEGEEYMSVLATVLEGVLFVERAPEPED